jgi:hypothetical protein
VFPILNAKDLMAKLDADPTITHMVVAAPWIPSADLQYVCFKYPTVKFAVNCHSNVGFLQADTNGVKLIRQYVDLEQGALNFQMGGNSVKFVEWMRRAFQATCAYLPNMYFLDYRTRPHKPLHDGGILRIGAFGATRPQKNLMSAAGAAIVLHEELKVDTEFWVSGGRTEGGGNTILNAVRGLTENIPGFTLKEMGWATWPQFRNLVRRMNLLIQVSYTESFNMVTADGISQGVPSVVSDAIDWAPSYWQAYMDDVCDMARVGRQLLYDPQTTEDGLVSLESHNHKSFDAWLRFLGLDTHIQYQGLVPTTHIR